jgi:hypothetical protein
VFGHAPMRNVTRLANLREDRNLCDYDHSAGRSDLVWGVDDSLDIVEKFLRDARRYLRARGVAM